MSRRMLADEAKPKHRRIIWLGMFVVVLFGGYSAGWFYVAGKLEELATQAIARLNRDGTSGDCANPVARGFPFRIGIYLRQRRLLKTRRNRSRFGRGIPLAGAGLRSRRIVAELDSPARISVPGWRRRSRFNWDNLRASARCRWIFPSIALGRGEKPVGRGRSRTRTATLCQRRRRRSAYAPNRATISTWPPDSPTPTSIRSCWNGGDLPPIEAASRPHHQGRRQSRALWRRAACAAIPAPSATLAVSSGEKAGLALAGPFSVDADGLVDADLTVTIRDPKALVGDAGPSASPRRPRRSRTSFAGLAAMGNNPIAAAQGRAKAARHARLHPAREICRRYDLADARPPGGRNRAHRFPGRPR